MRLVIVLQIGCYLVRKLLTKILFITFDTIIIRRRGIRIHQGYRETGWSDRLYFWLDIYRYQVCSQSLGPPDQLLTTVTTYSHNMKRTHYRMLKFSKQGSGVIIYLYLSDKISHLQECGCATCSFHRLNCWHPHTHTSQDL